MNKLPNYHGCFVCGDRNPDGLAVRFSVDEAGIVSTRFTPGATRMGYHGMTHGGILAALLDETMGWAPAVANRRFCVTLELTIRYLKPAPIGAELEIRGWKTSDTRRIWEADGEIRDMEGILYARGAGRYMPLSDERTREVAEMLTFDEGCVTPYRIRRDVLE